MPIYKRCICCGRLCGDNPHEARPYKPSGYACDECYHNHVIPAIKRREEMWKRKYGKVE